MAGWPLGQRYFVCGARTACAGGEHETSNVTLLAVGRTVPESVNVTRPAGDLPVPSDSIRGEVSRHEDQRAGRPFAPRDPGTDGAGAACQPAAALVSVRRETFTTNCWETHP